MLLLSYLSISLGFTINGIEIINHRDYQYVITNCTINKYLLSKRLQN